MHPPVASKLGRPPQKNNMPTYLAQRLRTTSDELSVQWCNGLIRAHLVTSCECAPGFISKGLKDSYDKLITVHDRKPFSSHMHGSKVSRRCKGSVKDMQLKKCSVLCVYPDFQGSHSWCCLVQVPEQSLILAEHFTGNRCTLM